jgi:lysophospholipase
MVTQRFLSSDRTPLYADFYDPQSPERGRSIVIVPGYCEHRGRYRATAAALAEHGHRVAVVDLRGHGESGGARAHVLRFAEYLEDLRAAIAHAAAKGLLTEPPVLLGHSMGGLVALRYALDRAAELRALVLTSPFLGLKLKVPRWKRGLGRIASLLRPQLALPSGLNPDELSHDPVVCRAYAQDPLVSRIATARWFTEVTAVQAEVRQRAGRLKLPLLLLHAGDDRIADPAASRTLFDRVGSSDKVMTLYPGLFHEILNEVDRDRVLADLFSWLQAH